ncbi:MAG: hypothetical protein NUV44_09365 [Candidatus Scalindua sp.]|nr:hypothetical protein [Candidatus Scalindua sp.]
MSEVESDENSQVFTVAIKYLEKYSCLYSAQNESDDSIALPIDFQNYCIEHGDDIFCFCHVMCEYWLCATEGTVPVSILDCEFLLVVQVGDKTLLLYQRKD